MQVVQEDEREWMKVVRHRLLRLSTMILAKINCGDMLKPNRNKKMIEAINAPFDHKLIRIGHKVDCKRVEVK